MKHTSFQPLVILLSIFIFSCSTPSNKSESPADTEETEVSTASKYKVYKAPASYDYPEAALRLLEPKSSLDTGATPFQFEVSSYNLGVQTPDAAERGIANSGKGQHIHFILDNGPYSAHYEPEFSKDLKEGKHVLLAFLSRSYHESVKNGSAYVIKEFTVGEPKEATASFDTTAQHLFYSRPKGTYSGKDTEKLMLDFFLFNTTIAEDGNKVRATINGEVHLLTDWTPYYIEGLEKGEATIKLELIDASGNAIPGPFNIVERTVTLTE